MVELNSTPFVAQIDLKLAEKIRLDLKNQGFELSIPAHTIFSAKKKGITCTLYQSGKMVVQGKERAAFIEFYLEPEILGTFQFSHPTVSLNLSPRIGIDESGKGDFFGPLCVAGVYAQEDTIAQLHAIGVRDSKLMNDRSIQAMAVKIKALVSYHIVKINPAKYNQIYADFKNLNHLLAWGHATTIEQMVQKTDCHQVIVDQFAAEWVVLTALKRKKLEVHLTQRHRAEEDLVVAAASILARDAFLVGLAQLSEEVGIILPKGASSATILAGKQVLRKWGQDGLLRVCKQHFKTLDQILNKAE
jgi:ribonuclease HIII